MTPIVIRAADADPGLSRWQRLSGIPVFLVACLFWTALFCAVLS